MITTCTISPYTLAQMHRQIFSLISSEFEDQIWDIQQARIAAERLNLTVTTRVA